MYEQGDGKKRRRLYRCDTEEQRDRPVQEKYGGHDQIMILNRTRYDGKTFPERVLDEIHSNQVTGEYFQTNSGQTFIMIFDWIIVASKMF